MIKSGEIVQIKDSAYDGLIGLTIYGNTVQNLWVNPSETKSGVTVSSNDDGSVTLSGSGNSVPVSSKPSYALKPNTTYTISIDKTPDNFAYGVNQRYADGTQIAFNYTRGKVATFTTSSSLAYVWLTIVVEGNVSGTYRVMLNEGKEPEPWCPPGINGVDELSIVTAGKNLLQRLGPALPYTSNGVTFSDNGDGGIKISGTSNSNAYFNFFGDTKKARQKLPAGDYVIGLKGQVEGVGFSCGYFNNAQTYDYVDWLTANVTRPNASGTLATEACIRPYVFVASGSTVNTVVYPQLELGSTATDYEPPNITTTPIDLDGHALNSLPDGTRDELHVDGDGRVTLIKRVQDIHLDGSTTWDMFTNPFVGYAAYWCNFGGDATGEDYTMLCDKLIVGSEYANSIYSSGLNGVAPYLREPSFATDADGVKTWIGSNTPNVVVSLANPKVIELGTIDLPKLRKLVVNTVYVSDDTPATIDVEYNRYRSGCDGFKVDGKHNYWDMRACLASRDTGVPEKKLSTVTVPYMSGFYDLSKLYGAIAFESREVTYAMEFVEDTTEELQARKSAILQWLSMVHDADIFDDDFPGYHFHGSYSDASWEEDDSGLQGSLEVTFLCHPFLIADGETSVSLSAGEKTVTVEGQPVNAYAVCASGSAAVKFRGVQQSVGTTPVRLSAQLQPGDNAVTVTGSAVTLTWNEERV